MKKTKKIILAITFVVVSLGLAIISFFLGGQIYTKKTEEKYLAQIEELTTTKQYMTYHGTYKDSVYIYFLVKVEDNSVRYYATDFYIKTWEQNFLCDTLAGENYHDASSSRLPSSRGYFSIRFKINNIKTSAGIGYLQHNEKVITTFYFSDLF